MNTISRQLIILFLTAFITSCVKSESRQNINNLAYSEDGCVKPAVVLAYPTGYGRSITSEKQDVLPLPPWKEQAEVYNDTKDFSASIFSMILRHRNGRSDQIWLSYSIKEQGFIAYYDFTTKKVVTYTAFSLTFVPKFIYSSDDGNIWGVAYDAESPQKIFFVKFNDAIEDFEIASSSIKYYYGDIAAITKDSDGLYWISLMSRDLKTGEKKFTFFSLDSKTFEAIEIPSVAILQPMSLAVGPDNKVWMIVFTNENWQLSVFDPVSKTVSTYEEPPRLADGFTSEEINGLTWLYFDKLGRLWVDDRGWFEFSSTNRPQWYRVVRSSVFIEEQVYSEVPYIWRRPISMIQSTDGMYWFTSPVGIVRLDEISGKWCLFTTSISKVLEDSKHQLWIVAGGRLYKYP
jgi:hypothetical protein